MSINIDRDAKRQFERGLECNLWGVSVREMNRDELIVFIGFLDDLLETERRNLAALTEEK